MKKYCNLLKLFLVTSLFSTNFNYTFAQVKITTTKVIETTLFLNGAFVKREANLNVNKGNTKIIVEKIPRNIELKTLQVDVDRLARILTVKPFIKTIKGQLDSVVIFSLKNRLQSLEKQQKVNEKKLLVLKETESLLKKNQPSFIKENAIATSELIKIIELNKTTLTEVYTAEIDILEEQKSLQKQIKEVRHEILKAITPNTTEYVELWVEVASASDRNLNLTVSYFTNHASWKPLYDFRVEDASKPVQANLKAGIIQNTGEDWQDIKLSVSNGSPSGNEAYTKAQPWILNFRRFTTNNTDKAYNPNIKHISGRITDYIGEPLIGANILIKENSSIGTITDIDGKFYLPVPSGGKTVMVSYTGYNTYEGIISEAIMHIKLEEGRLLDEIVVTGAIGGEIKQKIPDDQILKDLYVEPSKISYQATTFSYDMIDKVTLLNGTEYINLEVIEKEIPTIYEYYCAPKIDTSAFLRARLANWQDYNLLDGEINLYFEGKYLGTSLLNTKLANDTLDISLGRDNGIIVTRTKVKDFSKKSYFSNTITENRVYAIVVKNNKPQNIKIVIEESIPITTNKEIVISGVEAKSGTIDPDKKIVKWMLSIDPNKEVEQRISFTVKYPSNERVNLD
jgi:hypothetical protein